MRSNLAACVLFFCAVLWAAAPLTAAYATEDAIIAVVNDDVITYKDLMDYVRSIVQRMHLEGRGRSEIEGKIKELEETGLEKLIETRLIITEADAMGMEIDKRALDMRMDEIKKRYPSEEDFLKAIIAEGSSISDLRSKIEDEFKVKYLIDREVRDKIFINPQEVTDYYDAHPEQFIRKEHARLDSIYIPAGEDKAAAREQAQEALARLKEGTPFAEVAEEYSQAPSIGTIEKGQMLPEIESAVFSLKKGELSDVIEVDNGFFVIKLLDRTPSRPLALEDVKEQIENLLFEQKFHEDMKKWLNKLKEKAFIEIK